MNRKAAALTALAAVACIALGLSRVAHPVLAPACLLFVLFKHHVLNRMRFVLPDLLFVLAHASLFLTFVWFVLFSEIAYDQLSVLLGFAALWMILRAFAEPTPYNDFLIVLASLMIVVGSAAAAPGLGPALITGAYLVSVCHCLPIVMTGDQRTDEGVKVRLLGRPGRWSLAGRLAVHHLALGGLLLGSLVYLVVPRLAREAQPEPPTVSESLLAKRRVRSGAGGTGTPSEPLTGFPNAVRIGDIGSIKRSTKLAFDAILRKRARLYDPGPGEATMLLLRADAWETYAPDKRRWERRLVGRRALPADGEIAPGRAPIHWKVKLHGYDGRKLFVPQQPRRIRSVVGPIYIDLLGSVTSVRSVREYVVEAAEPVTAPQAIEHLLPDTARPRLLEVPPGLRRALRPYLDELVSGAVPLPRRGLIRAAADAIRYHFESRGFRYTLQLPPSLPPNTDPIVAFLQRREGHCELFASAACMLLRMLEVPARIAGGVRCSERVAKGHYRARFSNAHAWVEVACQGPGFVAMDFTPADRSAQLPTAAHDAGEFDERSGQVESRGSSKDIDWRDPFAYGYEQQQRLIRIVRDQLTGIVLPLAALAVAVLIGVGLVRRRKARPRDPLRISAPPGVTRRSLAFYVHWLRACAAQGHRRRRSQTPREFLAGLPEELKREGRATTAEFESLRYGSGG